MDATKDFTTIVRIYLDGKSSIGKTIVESLPGMVSHFPDLGIDILPKIGSALRWDCKYEDGTKAEISKHCEILNEVAVSRKLLTAYII